jgi:CheY-like chemotaxis protein
MRGRLVIADDSAEMRWLVRFAVGDDFAEVVEAADGRELMWVLLRSELGPHTDEIDVVVTDLCMPGYDGLDILDAWRDLRPTAPTILITAFPNEDVQRRAAELGATMLAKPFSTATLRRAVRAACARIA